MRTVARLALALAVTVLMGPAAARAQGLQVVDRDFERLPSIAQDHLFTLTLARAPSGAGVLLDTSDGKPLRGTPLGFTFPTGGTLGSYTASADRHVYGAVSTSTAIRVVDVGDLSAPGPLAPVTLGSIAVGPGFDPASTRMGIIAILIGFQTQDVPAVFYLQGGKTVVLAFDGSELRPAGLIYGDGLWYFL
jgi:hypothetical protein